MTTFDLDRPRPWYALLIALVIGGMTVLLAACGGSEADLPPPQGPTIAQQPADQSVTAGGSTTFTVSVSGSGATFQWQQLIGGVWTDLGGANSASLQINGASPTQNGTQYRAVTTVGGTTLISSPATLTVTPAPVAPTIAVQPADQTVTEPAPAIFNVTATGTATLAYQWQRNVGGTWTDLVGATGASFTTAATVRASDNGAQVRVVVTNQVGSQTSNVATLTVNPAPVVPAFGTQPSDAAVTAPSTASFTVVVTGLPTPALQWQLSIDGGATWSNVATGSGATSVTYTTAATSTPMSGYRYRAVATSSAGTAISNPALLTVNPAPVAPAISVQPADQTVTEPAAATFNATATGTATLAYQWQRNVAGTWSNITGATGPSYMTPATVRASDNAAQFRVVVTNGVGSQTSNIATLTVNPAPVAPALTSQPAGATVVEPASASFTVAATGTPAPTLQWQASTDGGASWANVATGSGATPTTYTTPATTTAMNGYRYRAVASSSAGTAISNTATLTVNAATAAPAISQQPANASVPSSTIATFGVTASGSPSPTYQWQRQAPGGGGFANITGATGASYTTPTGYFLDDEDVSDSGSQYRVVLTNSQGALTSSVATLTVTPAALTGFNRVSAGQRHTLALRSDGTVWAWGNNRYGQVGRNCSACSPRPVNGLSGTFTQVLARQSISFAVQSDGTVWAWGDNNYGQLGRNLAASNAANPTPAAVLRASDGQPLTGIVGLAVTSDGVSVLAWTAAGVAWKWGQAFIEPGLGGYPSNNFLAATPHVFFDGSSAARSISHAVAGNNGLVVVIDASGAAVFWTSNFIGSSFGTTPIIPFTARGFSGTAIDIAADGDRVAIVRSDNTLWGQAYQLGGSGNLTWSDLRFAIVQIAVPGPVTRAVVGRSGQVTYAWGAGGALYAAGFDVDGQLADGTAGGSRTTFEPVLTINDATQAAIGLETGLALRPGGAIWGWGNNFHRANGTSDSAGRPVRAPGWAQIEASPFALSGR